VPARVVRVNGKKVQPLDHIHTPDPVSQELCRLAAALRRLEEKVETLEGDGRAGQKPDVI
jgi:serine O-acetyltransferase